LQSAGHILRVSFCCARVDYRIKVSEGLGTSYAFVGGISYLEAMWISSEVIHWIVASSGSVDTVVEFVIGSCSTSATGSADSGCDSMLAVTLMEASILRTRIRRSCESALTADEDR
jgi:hypothetical protein